PVPVRLRGADVAPAGRDRAGGRGDVPGTLLERGGRGGEGGRAEARPGRADGELVAMSPADAIERLNTILAHAWMVRTFLKHADEIQHDADMLAVPRTLYDGIRAVEPAFQRGDHSEFLRRLKGKLPKFRKAAHHFRDHF